MRPPKPPSGLDPADHTVLLSRKDFLRGLAAAAFLPLLKPVAARADPGTAMAAEEIAPGVFVHQGLYEMQNPGNRGNMANCSFVVGDDAVAVIDTSGSAYCGSALRAAIRSVTDKPIRYVVNTHMHPDHVFGNAAFRDDEPIFTGHHNLAAALATRKQGYLEANERMIGKLGFAGSEVILPSLLIARKTAIDLGNRKLILEPQPTAHTNNDLILTDEKTGTLFLGDLLFSVYCPTLDGSIRGWLALIPGLKARKAARVVPGHGPRAMHLPDALTPEQRYLQTIVDGVRRCLKDGKTLEQAVKTVGYSEKDAWKLFDDYHRRNVTAAYAELEWE